MQVVVSISSIRLRGDKEYNKFDFKLMCFLCCIVGQLESSKDECFSLRTFDCQYKLWYCWERTLWMGENCFRKNSPGYWLTVADTFYHQMYNKSFRTSKNISSKYAKLRNPKRRNSRRPIDQIRSKSFYKVNFTSLPI